MTEPVAILAASCRELHRLPAALHALLDRLDDAMSRSRPAPREWSPVEIVCHLRDEETEDFGARVRAVVEGRDGFAPIDPERWVEERRYRDERLAEALADFCARRGASLELLAGIDPERLRGGIALRNGGEISGLDLVVAWATHDQLHLSQLAATLARLWANRWSPLRAEYAGPIPYTPEGS
jgi:hypothetical protein